jgi:Bacterial Ig-like domain
MMNFSFKPILLLTALCLSLMACGDGALKVSITLVTLTVPNSTVLSGSSQSVSAEVTGTGVFDPTVNWSASDGTLQKTTGALNNYIAPTVTTSKTIIITAISKADPTKFGVATITVNPIPPSSSISAVSVSAAKSALAAAEVTALTANVTGTGSFSNGVTWSISSGEGTLSATTGSSINFTAPNKATASTTVVRATSTQDSSKFGEVTLTTAASIALTASISSPSADVFVKGALNVQVVVTGAPDSVDLLKEGVVLASLVAPYTYSWDTTTEPEKTYSLTARAKKAGTPDVTSAAKQITVDRTAPTVVSRVPANGAVNVFLADEISATFSEPILASSVNTTNVQLKIGANVISSLPSLNAAGTKITIAPTTLPALTATINMVFTGLTDRAGNAAVIANSNFVAPDWNSIGTILDTDSSKDAYSPSIAMDSSGNSIIAWNEFDGTSLNIFVKKWNGSSWTPLGTILDNDPSRYAYNPVIALDSSGNPIVTWYEFDGTSSNIYAKKLNESTWTSLGTVLDNDVSKNASKPSIRIDSSDNPIVTWSESDGTSGNIYVKKWNGSSWTLLGTILDTDPSKNASNPSVAIDSGGNPIVTWNESDGSANNIFVKKWNGSSWTSLGAILDNEPTSNALVPSIAIDSSDNPIVTWSEFGGTSENIYVKKWNGSTWTSLGTILDIDPNKPAYEPAIAIDAGGNPIVTWSESDGTSNNSYVKKWNGSTWTPLGAILDTDPSKDALFPSIAIDSSSNPIVTYQELDGTSYNIYVKHLNRIP